jgi:hypothetical protein
MVIMDSDASNQSNSINFEQKNTLLFLSFHIERSMASATTKGNECDVAEGHCHRFLANARRLGVETEKKTTSILEALDTYVTLRQRRGDLSGAVTFTKEAYNVVVETYDCVHPQVQQAAGMLIECLINIGD